MYGALGVSLYVKIIVSKACLSLMRYKIETHLYLILHVRQKPETPFIVEK
jgi:hypothetical protein